MDHTSYPIKNEGIGRLNDNRQKTSINFQGDLTGIVIDDNEEIVELFSKCLEIKGIKILGKG